MWLVAEKFKNSICGFKNSICGFEVNKNSVCGL
jgi:hypothetical protein